MTLSHETILALSIALSLIVGFIVGHLTGVSHANHWWRLKQTLPQRLLIILQDQLDNRE